MTTPLLSTATKIDLSGGTGGASGQTVYTAPNGVVVTSSAPTYSNGSLYYLGYIFNGNKDTGSNTDLWLTSSSGNQTLTFDMDGYANDPITQISVYPKSRTDASSNYSIDVSNDGSSWTEIVPLVTNSTSLALGTERLHDGLNVTERYIRFNLTRNGDWGVTLHEIELYEDASAGGGAGDVGSYSGPESGSIAGTVSLSTPGEYDFTPTSNFTGEVRIWGAAGGGLNGGHGGFTSGTYDFVAGTTYKIWVGGGGKVNSSNSNGAEGGFGGGGFAGLVNNASVYSSSGGGLSGIFNGSAIQSNAIAIAGGGGGAGSYYIATNGAAGGFGGGASGGGGGAAGNGGGGAGGSQSGAGSVGAISAGGQGNSGSGMNGGNGASTLTTNYTGAGGGGGYFGGGSGGGNNWTGGGGGGGSGFASAGFTTTASSASALAGADDEYYIAPAGTPGPATAAQMPSGDGLVVIVAPGAAGETPNDDSYKILAFEPVYIQDFGGE